MSNTNNTTTALPHGGYGQITYENAAGTMIIVETTTMGLPPADRDAALQAGARPDDVWVSRYINLSATSRANNLGPPVGQAQNPGPSHPSSEMHEARKAASVSLEEDVVVEDMDSG